MNPRQRERALILLAIGCLALLAGDRLIVTPLYELWTTRNERIQSLKDSLAKGEYLLTRERELRKRWREMERDALPVSVSQAENIVLNSINRWINTSRVNLVSLRPQWKEFEEQYRTMECRAVAQGTIEQIIRFLYEIESDPICVKIDQVEISSRDDNSSSLTISVTFSGVQFIQEETYESTTAS